MTAAINFDNTDYGGIEIGTTFDKTLILQISDGSLFDMTNYTAKMYIKKTYGSSVICILTTENDRIVLGGVEGTLRLLIDSSDTVDLPVGIYIYDILLEQNGTTIKIAEGNIRIYPTVSV